MKPLEQAARAAQHAPSIFNTQPWSWRINSTTMELFADPQRRVDSIDPAGRLLLLSCGAALHHTRTYLAAAGWSTIVDRLPDPARPELLARIRLGRPMPPDPQAARLTAAMSRRRTDRRAFGDQPVAEGELERLRHVVEAEWAFLHIVRPDQIAMLAISAELAANAELDDAAYRSELRLWTSRPTFAGDGIPSATAVKPELRRVPLRNFFPDAEAGLAAGAAHDRGAAYVVLFGPADEPADLVRGGEALSALLLHATADGLATAPLSDAVEVEWPRHLVRGLISGIGEPYLVVRAGYVPGSAPAPIAPRRAPRDVITVTDRWVSWHVR
jgi:hypothetical protein